MSQSQIFRLKTTLATANKVGKKRNENPAEYFIVHYRTKVKIRHTSTKKQVKPNDGFINFKGPFIKEPKFVRRNAKKYAQFSS